MTDLAGTTIRRRAVTVAGHRTSVSIEDAFWTALKEIAAADGVSINALITAIDEGRTGRNLSSAVRVYVLDRLRRSGGPITAETAERAASRHPPG